jgi:hypothetical protein
MQITKAEEQVMPKVFFSILTAALLMTTVCCSATVMTMTMKSNEVRILLAGSGAVTIDYGDGTVKNGTLSEDDNVFNHKYAETAIHTITLTGEITRLNCKGNQITNLDVSKNTVLKFLFCENNQLSSLDVSKNIALAYLICHNNQLSSLDVSKNTAMTILVCENNQFTSSALNVLFGTLHGNLVDGNYGNKVVYISNNPGTSSCNRSIATNKGWTVNG